MIIILLLPGGNGQKLMAQGWAPWPVRFWPFGPLQKPLRMNTFRPNGDCPWLSPLGQEIPNCLRRGKEMHFFCGELLLYGETRIMISEDARSLKCLRCLYSTVGMPVSIQARADGASALVQSPKQGWRLMERPARRALTCHGAQLHAIGQLSHRERHSFCLLTGVNRCVDWSQQVR